MHNKSKQLTHALQLYSPHPPEAYSRPNGKDARAGVGYMLRAHAQRALWNLYWLSEPKVDLLLDQRKGALAPKLDLRVLTACNRTLARAVGGVRVEELVALVSPIEFVGWLERKGCRHLETHKLLGAAWLETMRGRSGMFRGVTGTSSNVSFVQFGQRPVTTDGRSAKIMPLASRKI